jgi:hypothetical protein
VSEGTATHARIARSVVYFGALVACACITMPILPGPPTAANYQARMAAWVTRDVNELISAWGAPSQEYRMPNGSTMYTWLWVDNSLITANYNEHLNMVTARTVTYWCKTTFTANTKSIIESWRADGNNCVSQ